MATATAASLTTALDSPRTVRWLGWAASLVGLAVFIMTAGSDWLTGGRQFAFDSARMTIACGGMALLVAGVAVMLPSRWRKLLEWVLVVVATLAVAFASDLVHGADQTKQSGNAVAAASAASSGQPVRSVGSRLTAKLVMLLLVAGAIGLTRVSNGSLTEESKALAPRRLADADTPAVGKFLALAAQLGLLILLIRQFNLVSPVFQHQISFLLFFGFLVHYLLPFRYRLPFFLFLSLCAVVFVFGLVPGTWLIGIGLVLIGLCHLPIAFGFRVALLVMATIALAEFRVGWAHAPWPNAIWPILTSMFMFRLIAYVWSLKHRKAPVGVWSSLSYFFLLPNVVFPLFPIVDYATFHRNYYDVERHLIHQTGVKWVFRGITHLVCYRFIYYYFVITPDEVSSVTDLVRYMVSNFMLILKVSGQFHIIIGSLLLFGFNLPPVMNRYFLASSFTDFWRRANIYWRDFMQRVLFYPVYFRLRTWPATAGLLCSVLIVFVITWALHGYQWFWLRGSFSVSGPDLLFWTLFGGLVAVNTVVESKAAGKKRPATGQELRFRAIAVHSLKILGVFSVVCFLWSIWISTSISEWLSLWSLPGVSSRDIAVLTPALIGAIAVAVWASIAQQRESLGGAAGARPRAGQPAFFPVAAPTAVLILLLFCVAQPAVYKRFQTRLAEIVRDVQTERFSKRDVAIADRAYYENLTRVDRFNAQLWAMYNAQAVAPEQAVAQPEEAKKAEAAANNPLEEAANQPMPDSGNLRSRDDFLGSELKPGLTSTRHGAEFHTNRWGMRDKDYELKAPPGTCRIALLGGSPEMHPGVLDAQLWEALLEDRLNRDNDHNGGVSRYEILNFSVTRYTALQRLAALDMKALRFDPDIVFYIAHPTDRNRATAALASAASMGTKIPYDGLKDVLNLAGVASGDDIKDAKRRLKPFGNDILAATDREVVKLCRQKKIVPVYILLPMLGELGDEEIPDQLRLAKEAGFKVVNLVDIFKNYDEASLRLTLRNFHPNAKGHQITADAVYAELRKDKTLLQKLK
jgi:D-alanyl-lipoteichoic acid acyltransferase DltB (MBOAT superfamily)